jgi:hypothetical protein
MEEDMLNDFFNRGGAEPLRFFALRLGVSAV